MLNVSAPTVSDNVCTIRIQTRAGHEIVFVDTEDYETAASIPDRWGLFKNAKGEKFARSGKESGQILLHKLLFDVLKGKRLEWINWNTLDLRKENLQLRDREGNVTPVKGLPRGVHKEPEPVDEYSLQEETEPLPGVNWYKRLNLWEVRLYHESKRYSMGYFKGLGEANREARIFRAEGPHSPKLKRNQNN